MTGSACHVYFAILSEFVRELSHYGGDRNIRVTFHL